MGNHLQSQSDETEKNYSPKAPSKFKLPSSMDDSDSNSLELFPHSTMDENIDEILVNKIPPAFSKEVFNHIGAYCNTKTFIAIAKTNSFYFYAMKGSSHPHMKYTLKPKSMVVKNIPYVRNLDCSKAHYIHDSTICKFKQLQKLNISRCENLTSKCFKNLEGSIKSLDMSHCRQEFINNLAFKHLTGIEHLKMEGCTQNTITEQAFEYLKGIKTLNIKECIQIPNSAFSLIKGSSLKILDLSNLDIDDEVLSNFPDLERLNLSGCNKITDSGIKKLKNLKILKLNHCKNLTNDSFGEHFNSLTELHISGCNQTSLNDEFFENLINLSNLEVLDVRGCDQINQKMIEKLRKRFPKLKE